MSMGDTSAAWAPKNPESRIENLPDGLAAAGGGYSMFGIPSILPGRRDVACMTANLTVAELLAEGVRELRASPAGTEPAANRGVGRAAAGLRTPWRSRAHA